MGLRTRLYLAGHGAPAADTKRNGTVYIECPHCHARTSAASPISANRQWIARVDAMREVAREERPKLSLRKTASA